MAVERKRSVWHHAQMLEGLDRADWAHLSHAYGAADDVPGLLRLLESEDEETRSDALNDLYGSIWHQGTVYQATAFAVPFLFELVQRTETAARDSIAVLLGLIARGRSYHEAVEDD